MIFEQLTDRIYHLRSDDAMGSLAQRYDLIHLPANTAEKACKMDGNVLCLDLGEGIKLQVQLRPQEDDDEWGALNSSFSQYFEKVQLNYKIKGRPDEVNRAVYLENVQRKTDRFCHRFGFQIGIGSEEAFYGLGEAAQNTLNLRGGEYQNWAAYQFDEIPIPFIMSTGGWGMLINADGRHFVDVGKRDGNKLTVLGNEDPLDVFLFRGNMPEILQCYAEITGRMMLLPKWAYGLTYIPSMLENQFEILSDAKKFRDDHIPCDHISVEPQWMDIFYDYSLEKRWDLTKFHMPDFMFDENRPEFEQVGRKGRYSFISALDRFGFHTSIWLCDAYDYSDEAERIAQGKETGNLPPWYEHLEKFVNQGVDGFKIDPADTLDTNRPDMILANGYSEVEMHNLSQVLLPKQVYEGMAKQLNQRPMLHYCGGYTGIQKWTAANTGDNGGQKGTMVWLQSLALSGHCNTTVDMDIHFSESMHFAMFAPWAHLNAWAGCSQPWWESPELYQSFQNYARLRYRLLPYLYSTAIECHETAMPILRPMPLAFPEDMQVRDVVEQYLYGPSLMVQSYNDTVVFPKGRWIDYLTGEAYEGNTTIQYTPAEGWGGGLFVKAGAIIPMWSDRDYVFQKSDEEIILEIWPEGSSSYLFREDDGLSLDYLSQKSCYTQISCEESEHQVQVTIGSRIGTYQGKPACRTWILRVYTNKNLAASCAEGDCIVVEEIK